jgi:hypothetical protein
LPIAPSAARLQNHRSPTQPSRQSVVVCAGEDLEGNVYCCVVRQLAVACSIMMLLAFQLHTWAKIQQHGSSCAAATAAFVVVGVVALFQDKGSGGSVRRAGDRTHQLQQP